VETRSRSFVGATITLHGLTHALVDTASICLYFTILRLGVFDDPMTVFFLYGIFAFAMQSPLGFLADWFNRPVLTAACGCLLVALAPFFLTVPLLALLVVGIGNALYHLGGGMITLSLSRGRASLSGVFVAPGTFGVAFGTVLGMKSIQPTLFFAALFAVTLATILLAGRSIWRVTTVSQHNNVQKISPAIFYGAMIFLCGTVLLRSTVGQLSSEAAKSMMPWFYAVPVAVFAGKFCGGFLADRFGWHRLTLFAILVSAPFLCVVRICPPAALVGFFLFSMSMSVTLAAMSNLLPASPGFAFGLTALCLAVGAFAALQIPSTDRAIFLLTVLSASLFYFGIRCYNNMVSTDNKSS